MKKTIFLFPLLLSLLCLPIFANDYSNPSKTVNDYLSYLCKEDYDSSYNLLSNEDKEYKTLYSYKTELKDEYSFTTSKIRTETTFTIDSSSIDNKTALVNVTLSYPDYETKVGEIFLQALLGAFSGIEDEDIQSILEEELSKGVTTVSKPITYSLIKENNEWKIYLNYKKEARIKELKDAASSSYSKENWDKAYSLYEELYLLTQDDSILETLDEVKTKLEEQNMRQSYIPNVELYDFTSRIHESFLGEKSPGFSFKLKNKGERDLSMVEVTVYFKDKDGFVIHEKTVTPIDKDEWESEDRQLKAHYIWQMKDGLYYSADRVPSEWEEGSAYAEITDLEFLD